MSTPAESRPGQVTMAGWMVMLGSAVVVFTVFERLGSLHTLETRETVERFLREPIGRGLGLSVETALDLLRVVSMVAAGCATATAVLGWHVLRRHRASRIALTVLAVPLFLTGIVAGGFFSSLVAASALMLWSRPARDWFDGRAPQPAVRGADGRGADGPAGPTRPEGRAPTLPPPYPPPPQSPDPAPHRAAHPATHQTRGEPPGLPRVRPDQVLWACVLTWSFTAISLLILVVSAVALGVDGSVVLEEARAQNPALDDLGLTDDQLLAAVAVAIAGLVVWALAVLVLGWLVFVGYEWARITLVVSSGMTAALAVLGVASLVTIPLLVAAVLVMRMLLTPAAAHWCRSRPRGGPDSTGPRDGMAP